MPEHLKQNIAMLRKLPRQMAKLRQIYAKISETTARLQDVIVQVWDINARVQDIQDRVYDCFALLRDGQGQDTNIRVRDMQNRMYDITGSVDTFRKHSDLMYWQLYRQDVESEEEAKKRFFYSLPKASGGLRMFQEGSVFLLEQLRLICEKYNFPYWLQFGTVLGAVRHKGFIPWDDDLDVAMFRCDILKLKDMLADHPDYQLRLVYDWNGKNRQYRFCTKDGSNPCFVDVYVYEMCKDASGELWYEFLMERIRLKEELAALDVRMQGYWSTHPYMMESDPHAEEVGQVFDRYSRQTGNIHDAGENQALVWAADNVDLAWKFSFPTDFVFPTVKLEFENGFYDAPREYMALTRLLFEDYLTLPEDIQSHFQHVKRQELERAEIKASIQRMLEKQQGDGVGECESG